MYSYSCNTCLKLQYTALEPANHRCCHYCGSKDIDSVSLDPDDGSLGLLMAPASKWFAVVLLTIAAVYVAAQVIRIL